jgi:glycosyltransferase involved in cell wall biosynthesis
MFEDGKITIIIPTYNRHKALSNQLKDLFSQDDKIIKSVIILDNSSRPSVTDEIIDWEKLTVYRHKFNVGLSWNVVTPYLFCDTKWLWILGDDDVIEPDAISIIKLNIFQHDVADVSMLKFSTTNETPDETDCIVNDYEGLVSYFSHNPCRSRSGNFIFISNSIFNMEALDQYISLAFEYSYSYVGFLVPVLKSLEDRGKIKFLSSRIVEHRLAEVGAFSYSKVALGMSTLKHINFETDEKTRDGILRILMSITPESLMREFLLKPSNNKVVDLKMASDYLFRDLFSFRRQMTFSLFVKFNRIVVRIYDLYKKFKKYRQTSG